MKDANFPLFIQYWVLQYLWSKFQEGRDGAWVLTTRYTQLDYLSSWHMVGAQKKKINKENKIYK